MPDEELIQQVRETIDKIAAMDVGSLCERPSSEKHLRFPELRQTVQDTIDTAVRFQALEIDRVPDFVLRIVQRCAVNAYAQLEQIDSFEVGSGEQLGERHRKVHDGVTQQLPKWNEELVKMCLFAKQLRVEDGGAFSERPSAGSSAQRSRFRRR